MVAEKAVAKVKEAILDKGFATQAPLRSRKAKD